MFTLLEKEVGQAVYDASSLIASPLEKVFKSLLCIRLARLKSELTNQDSAGGKNFTVLTSTKVNRNSMEIRPFISQEMA